jgi:hypothetical protein
MDCFGSLYFPLCHAEIKRLAILVWKVHHKESSAACGYAVAVAPSRGIGRITGSREYRYCLEGILLPYP